MPTNDARGRRAEFAARLLLRLKGYRILAERWKSPQGEIDIIARRGGTIAFIEVKLRRTADDAASSISRRQMQRVIRASTHFLASQPFLNQLQQRFDVILVVPGRIPRHILNAFDASDKNAM